MSVVDYRSIARATDVPISDLTTIIGKNNEGKSNLLRALVTAFKSIRAVAGLDPDGGSERRTSYLSTYRIERFYDWATDFPVSLRESQPEGGSSFQLCFSLSKLDATQFATKFQFPRTDELLLSIFIGAGSKWRVGLGTTTLSKEASDVCLFICERIGLEYISAVRTSASARKVVDALVARELAQVEQDDRFKKAVQEIVGLQKPVLAQLSKSIAGTLHDFVPEIQSVKLEIPSEQRSRALRHDYKVLVDDGTPTELESKGDGIQSLVAIALLRHVSEVAASGKHLILVIEEPESHLHPGAVHRLRGVLDEISKKFQIILSTHSPLFVNRLNVRANILVSSHQAVPASGMAQLREALGVRAADNLVSAKLMLLVEGESDRKALTALLSTHGSSIVRDALTDGSLFIDPLRGVGKLESKLAQLQALVCASHCFLDNDPAALEAVKIAKSYGLIADPDVQYASCPGMKYSELEDLFSVPAYSDAILQKFKVSLASSTFKGKEKWSMRMCKAFKSQAQAWNDGIEKQVKDIVADAVAEQPEKALNSKRKSVLMALDNELARKLSNF